MFYRHNCDVEVNALGNPNQDPSNPVGPIITSAIDNRNGHENPLNGYVIQDGTMPQAFSGILPCILDMMPGSRAYEMSLLGRTQAVMGHWKKRLFGSNLKNGPLGNTQVFLIMSHDGKLDASSLGEKTYIISLVLLNQGPNKTGNQATLRLKDDKALLEFQGVGKSD